MKPFQPVTLTRLVLLFVLTALLPASGYTSALSNLQKWLGWSESPPHKPVTDSFSRILFTGNKSIIHYKYEGLPSETEPTFARPKDNQIYIRWSAKRGDIFNLCFRKMAGSYPEDYPQTPVIKTSPAQNETITLDPEKTAAMFKVPGGLWQYTASFQLTDAGKGTLSIEGNNGWKITPDCGGISSTEAGVAALSSTSAVDVITLPNLILTRQNKDGSKEHTPDPIPSFPEKQEAHDGNNELLTGAGAGAGAGGGGRYDDDDNDPFRKKPGDSHQKPLIFFEFMSKWVGTSVNTPDTQRQPQSTPTLVLRPQIVLVVHRGWSSVEVLISPETWALVERIGRSHDPELLLAMTADPDDPKKAIENYLNKNTTTEDYDRYQREELILNPKMMNARLQSVSVFPGTCPSGVGCSGRETGNNYVPDMSQLSLYCNSGSNQKSTASRSSLSNQMFGNEKDDDDDGTKKPRNPKCEVCERNDAVYDHKCKTCLASIDDSMRKEAFTHPSTPEVRKNYAVKVSEAEKMDAGAIAVNRWLEILAPSDEEKMFLPASLYELNRLYQLLVRRLESKKTVLPEFQAKWEEFLKGDCRLKELIQLMAHLANSNGIDGDAEIHRVVTALALYRAEFETEESLKKSSANILYKEMRRMNVLNENNVDSNEYASIDLASKANLIKFIWDTIGHTHITMQHSLVPSDIDTIKALDQFAAQLFLKYGFGIPANMDSDSDPIAPWGFQQFPERNFITIDNEQYFRTSMQTLEGLVSSIGGLGFRQTDNQGGDIATMLSAVVILKPVMGPDFKALFDQLPNDQVSALNQWSKDALNELMPILDKNVQQKEDFRHYLYMIFGKIPRELQRSTTYVRDKKLRD